MPRPSSFSDPAGSRRVTIMDVAQRAGLSRSATAYALRNDINASKETRERVQRIAHEMGYRSDPMLSRLMAHLHSGRSRTYLGKIAFINPDPKRNFVKTTPALKSFLISAIERARALGYEIEEFWLHEPERSPKRLARILMARSIRGVILGGMETQGQILDFPWEHFTAIKLGYSVSEPALTRIVPHHYQNMLVAMERVLAAGYRRPGLLTLKRQENSMVKLHIAAFLAYQNELAPENRVGLMNGDSMEGEAIRAWFDEHRPDVILTTNFPAQLHFEEAGIRVPQDVALVSLLRWDEQVGIAGVRPGFERLGTVAVNILVSMLQHDERGEPVDRTTVELEGRWVDGESMPLAQSRKPKARSVVKSRRPG